MDTGGTIVVGVYSCVVATMALISSHYVMDYCAELMLSEASDTCSSWTTTGILLSSLGLFASAVMGIVLKKKAGGLYSTSSSATKLFLAVFGVSLTVAGFSRCVTVEYAPAPTHCTQFRSVALCCTLLTPQQNAMR